MFIFLSCILLSSWYVDFDLMAGELVNHEVSLMPISLISSPPSLQRKNLEGGFSLVAPSE